MVMLKLSTKLGNVALSIIAEPKADKLAEVGSLALQQLVFHKAPSSAYKKGSGLKREDVYSEKLRDGVQAAVVAALSPLFDNIKVDGSQYVAVVKVDAVADERRKAYAAMRTLDDKLAAEMYPECVEKVETEETETLS